MRSIHVLVGVISAGSLLACATPGASRSVADSTVPSATPLGIEEIYVLRSLRENRSPPGDFCVASKIGFAAKSEDRYSFRAVVTRVPDGKVVDARSRAAGTLHACFDAPPGGSEVQFYAEGVFAGIPAIGKGKCTPTAVDFPEAGITSTRCFLVLSNLPAPYVAGVLTTNSITSRQPIGDLSDPPGYIQPSIATVRLWRKR